MVDDKLALFQSLMECVHCRSLYSPVLNGSKHRLFLWAHTSERKKTRQLRNISQLIQWAANYLMIYSDTRFKDVYCVTIRS